MIDRLRKALVCAMMAAPLIGVGATPALAESAAEQPELQAGSWETICLSGRACIRSNVPAGQPAWYNFNGCGSHTFTPRAFWGQAHGNRFRVTYKDNRWDEVAAGSNRALDGNNWPKSVFVYC